MQKEAFDFFSKMSGLDPNSADFKNLMSSEFNLSDLNKNAQIKQ